MALSPDDCCSPAVTVYHVKSDGLMLPYERSLGIAIIKAVMHGKSFLQAGFVEQDASIDLKRMKQMNGITKEEEEIVFRVPWNPKMIASVITKSDEALRRKVLGMVLGELRQEDHLRKIIESRLAKEADDQLLKFVSYRFNPYLTPEQPMYMNFMNSLDEAAQLDLKGLENLLNTRKLDGFGDVLNDLMLLGFHGTNQESMDKILEMGMDPSLRKNGAHWFSTSPSCSMLYTILKTPLMKFAVIKENVHGKLVVFLVINTEHQLIGYSDQGILAVSSIDNQLPIGEVTLNLLRSPYCC